MQPRRSEFDFTRRFVARPKPHRVGAISSWAAGSNVTAWGCPDRCRSSHTN